MNKIVITKRSGDYHACIEGHPEWWGCGRTITEAIGDCIMNHKGKFNIEIIEK